MLVGLVGKPNVGKSTFFKAATLSDILIANYPFATIKPNHAIAYVKTRDLAAEFDKVSNPREGYVKNGFRFVPFEIMDVAGLVEGASEGKGLGNEFLNDLTNADAFIMVVDMSGETNEKGEPVSDGSYDPGQDITMIEKELDLWYYGILQKTWRSLARNIEIQKSDFAAVVGKQFSGLKVSEDDVKHVILKGQFDTTSCGKWEEGEVLRFARELRRATKPMIIAANKVDRPKGKENFEKIKEEFDYPVVACFAEGELTLRNADKAGLIEYVPGGQGFEIVGEVNDKQKEALDEISKTMQSFGSTGVQEVVNTTVFDILKYITVYPAGDKLEDSKGNVLPDCYLMKKGSTALDFAFRLHTDIGKGFVKAIDVKTKKAVGKDHVLEDGDGLEILTR